MGSFAGILSGSAGIAPCLEASCSCGTGSGEQSPVSWAALLLLLLRTEHSGILRRVECRYARLGAVSPPALTVRGAEIPAVG